MEDIVIRIIDGVAWRKLTAEEAGAILGKKVAAQTKKTGRVGKRSFTPEQREAQAKRMRAYWKAKKAAKKD